MVYMIRYHNSTLVLNTSKQNERAIYFALIRTKDAKVLGAHHG